MPKRDPLDPLEAGHLLPDPPPLGAAAAPGLRAPVARLRRPGDARPGQEAHPAVPGRPERQRGLPLRAGARQG